MEISEIQFVLNLPQLNVGDIILMNTYHENQRKRMGDCLYDHAAIYVGDAFIIEADGLGVVKNHIYSFGFKNENDACILRALEITTNQRDRIADFMRFNMGKEFGCREAYLVPKYKKSHKDDTSNRSFCSRLVAQAYFHAGIDVVENPNYCAPDDFLQSKNLEKIAPSTIPVNEELKRTVETQYKHRENEPNIILQESFLKMSKLYKEDIQTLEQLFNASIRQPELDITAIELLEKETRFFENPEEETKKNWPWFYSDEDFFKHFPNIDDALFFLGSQMAHYDNTFLPIFHRNHFEISVLSKVYNQSRMIGRVSIKFFELLKEATQVRKRLEKLYIDVIEKFPEEFRNFVNRYYFYPKFKYEPPMYDISNITISFLKSGISPEILKRDNIYIQEKDKKI